MKQTLNLLRAVPVLLLAALLLQGCGPGVSHRDFVAYVEDASNGLRQERAVKGLRYTLQYEPAAYKVLRKRRDPDLSRSELSAGISELAGMEYYRLDISNDAGAVGQLIDAEKRQWLAFAAEKDLHLLIDEQPVDAVMYHFEGDFGIRPFVRLLFAFPAQPHDRDREIVFFDRALSGEAVSFTLHSDHLEQIPNINS